MSCRCWLVAVAVGLTVASCGGLGAADVSDGAETTSPSTGGRGPAAPATSSPAASDWQAALDAVREQSGSPGALAAVDVAGIRWSGGSGEADTTGGPLDDATRLRIGSVTKTVTAALVLDAVARGELRLDDPVADVAPGLISISDDITVRMLLEHTSGLFAEGDEGDLAADIGRLTDPALRAEANAMAARFLAGEAVAPSVPLLIALAETHELYAPPGAGYHYSNINYLAAGAVLERVTGSTLAELLATRLAEPLGLTATTLAPADAEAPAFVGSALGPDGTLTDPGDAYLLLLGNGASGGVITTPDEMLTIMQSIVGGELLPPELVTTMTTPTAQSGTAAYGLGLARYTLSCGTFLGHAGSIDGTSALALVAPSGEDGVVLAVNVQGDDEPPLLVSADEILCGS